MKTIGMIGGLGWRSTSDYYRLINQQVEERLGDLSSAKIVLVSLNFQELRSAPTREDKVALVEAATAGLERAGADFFVICANTAHSHLPHFTRPLALPILHIASAVMEEASARRFRKLGILGTAPTIRAKIYAAAAGEHGAEIIEPSPQQVEVVHRIIQEELLRGELRPESKAAIEDVVDHMRTAGAESVILACTELQLFFGDVAGGLPVLDSLKAHVSRIVAAALDG